MKKPAPREQQLLTCVACGRRYEAEDGGPVGCPGCGCLSWVSEWVLERAPAAEAQAREM